MDKSKVANIKYKNVGQEKATIDKGYAMQPLLQKG
jgi:hypothetical protein